MNHFLRALLLIALTVLSANGAHAETHEQEFEKRYLAAINQEASLRDVVDITNRTPTIFANQLTASLLQDGDKKIASVEFIDPGEDLPKEFTFQGIVFVPSLPVEKLMRVTYKPQTSADGVTGTTYQLGLKRDRLMIVSAVPKN